MWYRHFCFTFLHKFRIDGSSYGEHFVLPTASNCSKSLESKTNNNIVIDGDAAVQSCVEQTAAWLSTAFSLLAIASIHHRGNGSHSALLYLGLLLLNISAAAVDDGNHCFALQVSTHRFVRIASPVVLHYTRFRYLQQDRRLNVGNLGSKRKAVATTTLWEAL